MLQNLLTLADVKGAISHATDSELIGGMMISNYTVMMILATILVLVIVIPAAAKIAPGTGRTIDDFRAKGKMANLVEAICLYLRQQVFVPVLKDQADRFAPILWTFFWFILACNILGLIPLADITGALGLNHGHGIGGTATQSIWVTAALAFIAFLLINITGLMKDPVGYFKHMTGGAPPAIWIIIIPVEAMGVFVKPVALALRLFANMTAGHILLAVLWSFVQSMADQFGAGGLALGLLPLLSSTAVYLLEVLVAVLQAYIFTFLTTVFIGQLIAHDHGHDHAHGHEGSHAGTHGGH